MSDLLGIGSSALTAYRAALNAVGENVANAETPGYARRAVTLRQSVVAPAADAAYRDSIIFNGVTPAAVARAWDAFRATETRAAASAAGHAEVRQQWLTALEGALDDGPAGVGATIGAFFDSAASLAGTPGEQLQRTAMLMALGDVANAFRNTAGALSRAADGIAAAARIEIDGVNGALTALHKLNGTLRTAAAGSSARAALEDQRDRLIDYVAERLDVGVTLNGDGTAALALVGSTATPLLTGPGAGLIIMTLAADGRISLGLSAAGTTGPLPVSGGRLAGLVEVAAATAGRRAELDSLATDFAADINAWSAGGTDANGNPGADLLEAPTGATSLRRLTDDPALIPAANASSANGNLLAIEAVRSAGGHEARWAALVSGNGQALASAQAEASAAGAWRDRAFASLDEVTGVDLDREAADLLRYQQAYNGAARIVQVARDTINEILRLF